MKEIMTKFLNGKILTERELMRLTDNSIDDIEEEAGRWTVTVQSIIKFEDKFYAIDWQRGLTECKENEFDSQPYEVERKERIVKEVYYIAI